MNSVLLSSPARTLQGYRVEEKKINLLIYPSLLAEFFFFYRSGKSTFSEKGMVVALEKWFSYFSQVRINIASLSP